MAPTSPVSALLVMARLEGDAEQASVVLEAPLDMATCKGVPKSAHSLNANGLGRPRPLIALAAEATTPWWPRAACP